MSGFRNVIIANPCRCSYKGGYLVVRKEDDTTKVHLSEISSLTLQTTQAYVSAYLLSELAKSKISVIFCDEKSNPVGQYLPLYGAHNTSKRITEQLAWGEPIKKRVWQRVVKDKIAHQSQVLAMRAREEASEQLAAMVNEVRSGDTTCREACAAKVYFQALFGEDFSRDQENATNAALNYGYSVILSAVNRELVARGCITQVGICHKNEYNQFNLGCDLMEPFRPVIDKLVFDNVVNEFNDLLKLVLVDALNTSMPYRGGSYKLSSVISMYVQDCLNALNKKLSVDSIEPFDIA